MWSQRAPSRASAFVGGGEIGGSDVARGLTRLGPDWRDAVLPGLKQGECVGWIGVRPQHRRIGRRHRAGGRRRSFDHTDESTSYGERDTTDPSVTELDRGHGAVGFAPLRLTDRVLDRVVDGSIGVCELVPESTVASAAVAVDVLRDRAL